jgi:hypothetical protein
MMDSRPTPSRRQALGGNDAGMSLITDPLGQSRSAIAASELVFIYAELGKKLDILMLFRKSL